MADTNLIEKEYKVFDDIMSSGHIKSLMETFDLELEEAEHLIEKGRKLLGLRPEE